MTQPILQLLSNVKKDVDIELDIFFAEKINQAAKIDRQYKKLLTDMNKFIRRGGKRIRPFIGYLGYCVGGDTQYGDYIKASVSLELYHNFLLIHDDVMDRDTKRYGGLNINGLYQNRFNKLLTPNDAVHFGNAIAIMAGDINLGLAIENLLASNFPQTIKEQALGRLLGLNFEIAAGQVLDVIGPSDATLDLKHILKMYQYKTASHTTRGPLQIGAILSGANSAIVETLGRYGTKAGIAFQLIDDLLGLYGTSARLGKPVLSDLREGKKTVLIYYAFQFAPTPDKQVLKSKLGNSQVTMADLRVVRKIITDCGAQAKTLFLAQQYVSLAKAELKKLELPNNTKQLLGDLADYIVERDY